MSGGRHLGLAVLMALISAAVVLGSVSLSFLESGYSLAENATQDPQVLFPGGQQILTLVARETSGATPAPGELALETAVASEPTPGLVLPPTATPISTCEHPEEWAPVSIYSTDTLRSLAHRYNTSVTLLKQFNCLTLDTLPPEGVLYVPPLPPATATLRPSPTRPGPTQCSPPPGWVRYTVRSGDTLYSLAVRLGSTVGALQSANCLSSASIYTGQVLWLPGYPPVNPTATRPLPTVGVSPTVAFPTLTPLPPSATPTRPLPPTATHVTPPTATPTDPPTDTPLPSDTPVPTNTPQPTNTPAPSNTPAPATNTPIPLPPTNTPQVYPFP